MTTRNPIPVVLTRQAVVVAPTRGYLRLRDELAARTHRIRNRQVDPGSDTLHRVAADTRAADLDLRLLGRPADGPGKIVAAADRIAALATAGGLQIVYADRGGPRPDAFNIHDELRAQLAARGIPARAVRHLYQARGDADRAALFDACRTGQVTVLVTGSRRMPADLPARAVALHHLDCPRSAADLRRREGAAARRPDPPRIFRYIIAGSGEPAAWAALIRPHVTAAVPPHAGRAFAALTQIRPGVIPATSSGPAAAGTGQHPARGR